ncbi:MAG: ABC transporter ATP-binding protein [Thermoproteota archaeon]|nr:ABC transporter ATP-binding protein [Candidatus Brockarchaeota archaeon]
MITKPLIKMEKVSKKFPNVIALDNVDFSLIKGEIHALLGENGAGKTTLMKILFGMLKPDSGTIYINGKKVNITSPRDAMQHKIGMVHQHFMLVDSLTVLENIALSYEKKPIIDYNEIEKKIKEISERYNFYVDPKSKIWQLSVGEQQKVEIIKALCGDVDVLILDEPTSVLTPIEVEELFKALNAMRKQGKSIIFITHKLDEAISISDRITVLRKGKVVGVVKPSEVTKSDLVKMMVGREIAEMINKDKYKSNENNIPLVEVENLVVFNDRGLVAVNGASFVLYPGEILGIAGITGNGQRELAEALIGARRVSHGKIKILGINTTNKKTRDIIKLGVSYIPEDRIRFGILPNLSVTENLLLTNYDDPRFSRKLTVNYHSFRNVALNLIKEFNIVTPNLQTPAKFLSGGNLQKLLIARSAVKEPKLIIVSNPTSGLDVATVALVHEWLIRMKKKNVGIILISEDLEEIIKLSDKIIVLKEGKITGNFVGEAKITEVATAMTTKVST